MSALTAPVCSKYAFTNTSDTKANAFQLITLIRTKSAMALIALLPRRFQICITSDIIANNVNKLKRR